MGPALGANGHRQFAACDLIDVDEHRLRLKREEARSRLGGERSSIESDAFLMLAVARVLVYLVRSLNRTINANVTLSPGSIHSTLRQTRDSGIKCVSKGRIARITNQTGSHAARHVGVSDTGRGIGKGTRTTRTGCAERTLAAKRPNRTRLHEA